MSAFRLIASATPPDPDVGDTPGKRYQLSKQPKEDCNYSDRANGGDAVLVPCVQIGPEPQETHMVLPSR